MNDDELRKRIKDRKWYYNNFTCYLLEVNITMYTVSQLLGINQGTVSYWLHHELSAPVNAFFYTMRKLWITYNVSLVDLF